MLRGAVLGVEAQRLLQPLLGARDLVLEDIQVGQPDEDLGVVVARSASGEAIVVVAAEQARNESADAARLEAINELARLERMAERILDVDDWDELLATP